MLRKAFSITITVTTDGPWISFEMPATSQPAGLEPPQSVQSTWPLAPESSTPDWPAPLRLGWAWTLATLHDWTPWPVLSLLPILLSSSIPVAGASSRRFALAVRSIPRPAWSAAAALCALCRRCSPFLCTRCLFSPPFIPLFARPSGLLTTPSASNPVASRPLVFEFSPRPRPETSHALECPAATLDAPLVSSSQSSRHGPQTAHRRRLPPAACPGLDCDIPPAPAYDAAGRDLQPLNAPTVPFGARPDRRRHAPKTATIINPRISCDIPPLSTQAAVPSPANHLAPVGPAAPDHVAHKIEAPEEEPYTIKCICNFSDDDGNTIYCETCDTWQHIDCFYPENREEAIREDFSHSCADCQPRPLNRQKAIERTLGLRTSVVEPESSIDKKPKRLPSKSHKKKKPSEAHFNGIHGPPLEGGKHGHNGDHHHPTPAKKSKTSHRPSLSVSSQPSKRSPSYGNSRTNPTHPPSPATTPPDLPDDFTIHHYSEGFCSLYNDVPDRQNNGFASLAIPTALMRWLDSSSALEKEVGRRRSEIFQDALPALERKRPKLEVKDATQSLDNGTTLRWRSLKSTSSIEKDVPLIELNGEIGFQKDYCAEGDNLWGDISSPLPFVFFHPILPLYIDTRKEGSIARFARRSCKPNAQLDTFLTGGSEYHFWLVSDRYIPPNEQITLPWDFRLEKSVCQRWLHLLGLSDDDSAVQDDFELDESEYTAISNWIDRILSEYGGCACDQDNNCAFARFHRHYLYGKSQSRGIRKRSRNKKAHTISPTSTGHATNSRAASEGHLDDQADREGRDGSVAARSKPSSRDRTPLRQGSFDQLGILTEPTDRDKRKVAMVEDSFRRMEQEQQQPPRKKKRLSDGTTVSTSSKAKSRTGSTPHIGSYADAGTTARSKSGSPASSRSPNLGTQSKSSASHREPSEAAAAAHRQSSASPRPLYCDMGIQTDPVEDEWFSALQNMPCRKKKIISLSKRLLNSRYKARAEEDRKRSTPSRPSSVDAMDVDATEAEQQPKIATLEVEKQPEIQHALPSPAPTKDADTELPDAPPPPLSHSQEAPAVEKEAAQEPLGEPSKEAKEEPLKESPKEPVTESLKESPKEPVKATVVESEQATEKEPVKESIKEPVQESVKEEPPATQEPSAREQPAKEEPAKEESAKEEPAKEEPAKEEPAKEEPAKEEPIKEPTKQPTKAESIPELPTKEPIKEAQTASMKIKAPELRVQMPTTSVLDSSTALPTTTTPSSATSSVVQSAILSGSLPSPFGSAVNGAVATPSPIKKKLSLSDYKSRMSKAAAKPSLSLISTKSSLSEADEIKLENPTEPAAIEKVESAVVPSAPAATTNGHA
ncbi:hypothetical protein MKX08_004252 [Trichoderma sp. CBMAI-0020]|nr:hypothetical protein MKX08_004252 [Trichoderma sp. CBMAI-0020]